MPIKNIPILCPECQRANTMEASQKEENRVAQLNNDDAELIDEEDNGNEAPQTIVQLNNWVDYCYHLLEVHPDSERAIWAKGCLEKEKMPLARPTEKSKRDKAEKTAEKPVEKVAPKNTDELELVEIKPTELPDDEKYANDLQNIAKEFNQQMKELHPENSPIKRSKPTFKSRLAKLNPTNIFRKHSM